MPRPDPFQQRPQKSKALLADQLSELCHTLDPNSGKWSTETRNQFNHLYSELSEIDEKRARR
jgi:hypothetical protein